MVTWELPVIINNKLVRVQVKTTHGSKHAAYAEYKRQQEDNGVIVQGCDFGQAWSKFN